MYGMKKYYQSISRLYYKSINQFIYLLEKFDIDLNTLFQKIDKTLISSKITQFNKINNTRKADLSIIYNLRTKMYKGIPYSNKIIKRREQERIQVIHKQNLRNIRPLTTNIEVPFQAVPNPFVSNKKKDMLQEDRFTQIQRENRMLLEKIHTIMSKKPSFKQEKLKRNSSINNDKQRMNKSLNQVYRKKQLGDIQIQNAKLLKRIMDKKSDYDSKKLKQEWKKQKQVIKNIANYPFIIRDRVYKGRKKSMTSHSFNQAGFNQPHLEETALSSPIQLVRIRNLSGHNFLITVKYDGNMLQILGDNKSTKEIKIIEIPKEEGLEFIQYECEGKIELIFDCLRYDATEKVLYLVGKEVDLGNEESVENQEQKFNTQNVTAMKNDQNQQKEKEQEKGMKKREMSNIYQIENSQMETEPQKITQHNMNSTNMEDLNQAKSHIQIQDENMKGIKEESQNVEKPIQNNLKDEEKEEDNQNQRELEPNFENDNVQNEENIAEVLNKEEEKKEQIAQVQTVNDQNKQEQNNQEEKVQQNQQPNEAEAHAPEYKKDQSKFICGIKSQYELTNFLQKSM